MLDKEQQECDKELIVRTNEQIRKQHMKKLSSFVTQEYKLKNISSIIPSIEQEIHLSRDSDLQLASNELKQFPIIQEYQIKSLQQTTFSYHFIQEMQYYFKPLGEELFSNQLVEEEICFILKGKVSIFQRKTNIEIEQNFIDNLLEFSDEIIKEIIDKNLQEKMKVFIKTNAIKQQNQSLQKTERNITFIQESIQSSNPTSQNNIIQRSNARRKTKKVKTKLIRKKSSIHIHNNEDENKDSISQTFNKEEIKIIQPIIKEIFMKKLFRLIDKEVGNEYDENNIINLQNQLLLWYQTKVDFYFNDYGVPQYKSVQSFYSGQHFSSKYQKGGIEDSQENKQFIIAADDLHYISIKRSQYESIQNYSDDQINEKIKVFQDKFIDISKNNMVKFVYYFKKKEFKRKDHIWNERDQCNGFYYLINGEVEYVRSYKTKINNKNYHDNHDGIKNEENSLAKKNDTIKRELHVWGFHEGNFIGLDDLFDFSQKRVYSVIVKSDIVQAYYLQIRDLENIKKSVPQIVTQLVQKSEGKKKLVEQKWIHAISNFENKIRNKNNCLSDILEEKAILSGNSLMINSSSSMRKQQNTEQQNLIMERQKLIERKEKSKFTNTNNIKEIDKLFRKEFGKKKYLQMISNNPQVILSDSTLNSLESIMNLSDDNIKIENKQSEEKAQEKQEYLKNESQKKRLSLGKLFQQKEVKTIQPKEQPKIIQAKENNPFTQKSIMNIVNVKMALKKFAKNKKITESSSYIQQDDYDSQQYQFNQNDYFNLESQNSKQLEVSQLPQSPQLNSSKRSSINGSYSQNTFLLTNDQCLELNSPKNIDVKSKLNRKILSKKEKYIQRQQKLQDEIKQMRQTGLNSYLSDQQLQHLAEKKLQKQEDLKDINRLNIFEQQKIKQSLLKKPIRPGQKEMFTDEQKLEMKVQLSQRIEEKSEIAEHDFIFKSVLTPQSIKSLQFKINQKLKNKSGFQTNSSNNNDKPWRQDTIQKQETQNFMMDSIQKRNSIISIQNNNSNNLSPQVQSHILASYASSPQNSHSNFNQLNFKSASNCSSPINNIHKKQQLSIGQGNDRIIENIQQDNYMKWSDQNQNELIQKQSYSIVDKNQDQTSFQINNQKQNQNKVNLINHLINQNKNISQQLNVPYLNIETTREQSIDYNKELIDSQQINGNNDELNNLQNPIFNRRTKSASPSNDINQRIQSPIILSRNYHSIISNNQSKSPRFLQSKKNLNLKKKIQICNDKSNIASLVSSIEEIRKNVEQIKQINQNISSRFKNNSNIFSKNISPPKLEENKNSNHVSPEISRSDIYSLLQKSPKQQQNLQQQQQQQQQPILPNQTENNIFKQPQQTTLSIQNGYQNIKKQIINDQNNSKNIKQQQQQQSSTCQSQHFPMFDNFYLGQNYLQESDQQQTIKYITSMPNNSISRTQFTTILTEQAPLTITSLNIQDFCSFDHIRVKQNHQNSSNQKFINNNSNNNNNKISKSPPQTASTTTFTTQFQDYNQNIPQHNLQQVIGNIKYIQQQISNDSQFFSNIIPDQQQLSQQHHQQQQQQQSIVSRKYSQGYVNPNVMMHSQQQSIGSKSINQTPQNESRNDKLINKRQEQIKKNNLPYQRIHSAKARKQTSEQIIHSIDSQFKISKGLLIFPNQLLKNSNNNSLSIK